MNQLKYLTRLHFINLLSATFFTVLAGYYFGFGVQMNLACGISSRTNRWSGMFMSYPLLLVPFVVYNYFKLQQIPTLFKSTVSRISRLDCHLHLPVLLLPLLLLPAQAGGVRSRPDPGLLRHSLALPQNGKFP